MAKRKFKSKRSLQAAALPKGLPQKKRKQPQQPQQQPQHGHYYGTGTVVGTTDSSSSSFINPFDMVRATKRPKHDVHNRKISSNNTTTTTSRPHAASALASFAMQQRQEALKTSLQSSKKSNQWMDHRIGEYGSSQGTMMMMTREEQMLARLVKERSRQSKRNMKFQLNDDNNDDNNFKNDMALTHRGKSIDQLLSQEHHDAALLSDDDDDDLLLSEDGDLNVLDTELHFGGDVRDGGGSSSKMGAYGPNNNDHHNNDHHDDLQQAYTQRKMELDDLIARRKFLKAERLKIREEQEDQVAKIDDAFGDISQLLQFRDKEQERRQAKEKRMAALQDKKKNDDDDDGLVQKDNNNKKDDDDDDEMADWDVEMRQYMWERRVQATDRTKTPEEIAKEQADRLQQLETRRLARMQGDFEDDDLTDVSDSSSSSSSSDSDNEHEHNNKKKKSKRNKYQKKKASKQKKKKKKKNAGKSADALDDDDEEVSDGDDDSGDEKLEPRFTGEGIVYVNRKGKVVDTPAKSTSKVTKHVDSDDEDVDEESEHDEDEENDDDDGDVSDQEEQEEEEPDTPSATTTILTVGTKVRGNYHAKEQFGGHATWYDGVVTNVHEQPDGTVRYDVEYDDGDFEEGMEPEHVRPIPKNADELSKEDAIKAEELALKRKHQKAKQKARSAIPYVFEVPTTLEALHDMIANHAATGEDASLIIQRIHATNSVRLDRRNMEKMQNFYDVLLRRFMAVGDAIHTSGDGGKELARFQQLDELTKVLYQMAQDSPVCAGAVWGRRIGILQNAHAKRLRDAALVGVHYNDDDDDDDDDNNKNESAWPSTGVILLLRALQHIFPVTDMRHPVVTPALLMLGQMVVHTPIRSVQDIVMGILCSALMIEYTREAKRIVPEALAFLSAVLCLFVPSKDDEMIRFAVRSLEVATQLPPVAALRELVSTFHSDSVPPLSLERQQMEDPSTAAAAILFAALHLVEACATNWSGAVNDSEPELFGDVTLSLLELDPNNKKFPLPKILTNKVASTAAALSSACQFARIRQPLQRRATLTVPTIKTLAPRMEDPSKYSMSQKDKGKDAKQAAMDRTRREFKREKKAVSRELRLDAAIIENERRQEQERKDTLAREKRHKNFAWLEGEQASMNQQVRLGGGLLKGGGVGAAKAKAATAKLGIKKGGRF